MAESKARTVLNEGDQKIIDAAYATRNPSIFTDYYFRNTRGGYMAYPGSVRHALYYESWKLSGKPASFASRSSEVAFEVVPQFGDFSEYLGPRKPGVPLPESANMAFFEKRGFLFLPWALNFDRARQEQLTVIGLTGTGKTKNIGLLAMYHCATTPNFRFLNVAPTIYQSNLMVRSIMETMQGSLFEGRFLLEGKKGFKEKPYAMFKFANGSTADWIQYRNVATSSSGVTTLSQQAPFTNTYHAQRVMPRPFLEKTDIQLQAKTSANTYAVSIAAEGYLILNNGQA